MKTFRRMAVATMAASLCIGVAAAPSATAADAPKARSAQSAKAVAKRLSETRKSLSSVSTRTRRAERRLTALDQTIATLKALSEGADGKANTLLGAAPQLVSGLTALRSALEKDVGPGLLALKTALETQVAPGLTALKTALETQIAPGLKTAGDSIKSLAAAQEYGVVQAFVGNTAVPGAILTSSDIPDDTNQATVSGELLLPVAADAAGETITLRAAVRSGEDDGTGPTDPVGVAGLISLDDVKSSPNVTVGGGGASGTPLTSAPNAAFGGAPVYGIAEKTPRVDATPNPLSFPSEAARSIDLTGNLANGSKLTVTEGASAAGYVVISVTARFHDLTASATDLNE